MIKRALVTSTLVLALAQPASAETLFRGIFQFTAVNSSCTDGPHVGDNVNGRFHPRDVAGNRTFTALNVIWPFGGESWELDAGSFTSAYVQVTNYTLSWNAFTPDKPSFLLVSQQSPATLTATTPDVSLLGKIKNPWGEIGQENCIGTFRFTGVREL